MAQPQHSAYLREILKILFIWLMGKMDALARTGTRKQKANALLLHDVPA
jgi:hypothetical protein